MLSLKNQDISLPINKEQQTKIDIAKDMIVQIKNDTNINTKLESNSLKWDSKLLEKDTDPQEFQKRIYTIKEIIRLRLGEKNIEEYSRIISQRLINNQNSKVETPETLYSILEGINYWHYAGKEMANNICLRIENNVLINNIANKTDLIKDYVFINLRNLANKPNTKALSDKDAINYILLRNNKDISATTLKPSAVTGAYGKETYQNLFFTDGKLDPEKIAEVWGNQ